MIEAIKKRSKSKTYKYLIVPKAALVSLLLALPQVRDAIPPIAYVFIFLVATVAASILREITTESIDNK